MLAAKWMLRIVSVSIWLVVLFLVVGRAQVGHVFFNPDTTEVLSNDTFEVTLEVDTGIATIHCYIVSLEYDRTFIELLEVQEGPLLADEGFTFFFYHDWDSAYDIGCCLMKYGFYADGPGVLATLQFRAGEQAGMALLTFLRAEFSDTVTPNPNLIPVEPQDDAVIVIEVVTSSDTPASGQMPESYALSQNYPNPFNPTTEIAYQLPQPGRVRLSIYNIQGQVVRTLVDVSQPAGYHTVVWDSRTDAGRQVAGGVYLYRLEADSFVASRKMLLLR